MIVFTTSFEQTGSTSRANLRIRLSSESMDPLCCWWASPGVSNDLQHEEQEYTVAVSRSSFELIMSPTSHTCYHLVCVCVGHTLHLPRTDEESVTLCT